MACPPSDKARDPQVQLCNLWSLFPPEISAKCLWFLMTLMPCRLRRQHQVHWLASSLQLLLTHLNLARLSRSLCNPCPTVAHPSIAHNFLDSLRTQAHGHGMRMCKSLIQKSEISFSNMPLEASNHSLALFNASAPSTRSRAESARSMTCSDLFVGPWVCTCLWHRLHPKQTHTRPR